MSTKQTERLNTLLEEFDKGAVQPHELMAVVKAIMGILRETKDSLSAISAHDKKEAFAGIKTAISDLRATETKLKAEIAQSLTSSSKSLETTKAEVRTLINEVYSQIGYVESLIEHYDDSAVKKMIEDVREQIPPSFDATEIQEEIKEHERRIDELEEKLKVMPRGGGGGVTDLRIRQAFKNILLTEAPVGAIDGVNATYTLTQPIFAILSMSINGETIAELPNYTISNRSFTFAVALPSAYSGKDFEVKYIG